MASRRMDSMIKRQQARPFHLAIQAVTIMCHIKSKPGKLAVCRLDQVCLLSNQGGRSCSCNELNSLLQGIDSQQKFIHSQIRPYTGLHGCLLFLPHHGQLLDQACHTAGSLPYPCSYLTSSSGVKLSKSAWQCCQYEYGQIAHLGVWTRAHGNSALP